MKNSFYFPAYLIVFLLLAGSVSLLSACGGPYSTSSSSGSGSTGGGTTVTSVTMTCADLATAQTEVSSAVGDCQDCHTLTQLSWSGNGAGSKSDLSTLLPNLSLTQIESDIVNYGMPLSPGTPSPMDSANVNPTSEYLACEAGSTTTVTGCTSSTCKP